MRKYRKRQHIENVLRTRYTGDTLFDEVYLSHSSMPLLSLDEIDTSVDYFGHKLDFPLMINAMTGGTDYTEEINRNLSTIAKRFNMPIAVGSMTIALEDEESIHSFQVVRETMGSSGIVLANLNSNFGVKEARKVVEMIDADILQIHINPGQELAMEEGDRDFRHVAENIGEITASLGKPVIVKEVGFGLSADVVRALYELGVRHVDISGYGGTNFFEVENLRDPAIDMSEFYNWGIPTAYSLYQVKELGLPDLSITASGGIKNAGDIVKSFVLGANMCGMSGEVLKYLLNGGVNYAEDFIDELIYKTKILMVLVKAKDLEALKNLPWIATGKLKDLIEGSKKGQ